MRERSLLSHSSDYLIARLTALWALVKGYKNGLFQGNLLLVVRDFLVDDVKSCYGLSACKVINDLKAWIKL